MIFRFESQGTVGMRFSEMLRITESEFSHLGNNSIKILLKFVIRDVLCNSWLMAF